MPDLLQSNHIEAKPPFSASNYNKKVTLRPTAASTPEEEQKFLQNTFKVNAKPTKTSVEHIVKQAAGSRQTHLIRGGGTDSREDEREDEEDEDQQRQLMRDMFGNSGQSLPPVHGIRGGVCWLVLGLLFSRQAVIILG